MGIGYSSGDNRAVEAVERGAALAADRRARSTGAKGILLSIAGGEDLSLFEVNEAAEIVRQRATDDTNIIFGATIDERLTGQVWVTVVATGFGGPACAARRRSGPAIATPSTSQLPLGSLSPDGSRARSTLARCEARSPAGTS